MIFTLQYSMFLKPICTTNEIFYQVTIQIQSKQYKIVNN